MAAVYLFREPLGYETVETLYKLGPSYKVQGNVFYYLTLSTFCTACIFFLDPQSQFKFAAESDAPLSSQEKKVPPPTITTLSPHPISTPSHHHNLIPTPYSLVSFHKVN
jgi:hypothetical protein